MEISFYGYGYGLTYPTIWKNKKNQWSGFSEFDKFPGALKFLNAEVDLLLNLKQKQKQKSNSISTKFGEICVFFVLMIFLGTIFVCI